MTDTKTEKDVFDALGIEKPTEEKAPSNEPVKVEFDVNKYMASEFGAIKAELEAIKNMVSKLKAEEPPKEEPVPAPVEEKKEETPEMNVQESEKTEEKHEEPVSSVPQSAPKEKVDFSDFNFRDVGKLIGKIGFAGGE